MILDLFSAIEERDVERILRIYDSEVEFHWPADGKPGRAQMFHFNLDVVVSFLAAAGSPANGQ